MIPGSDQPVRKPAPKFVPMTAQDFERARLRKIAIWVGGIFIAAILVAAAVWKVSEPAQGEGAFQEATRLYGAAKYPEAIKALDRTIAAKVNLADSYLLRGNIYRLLNQPARAIPDLTAVIEIRPDDPELYRLRAQCLRDVGSIQQAIADYDRLIRMKPSAAAYTGLGICYRDQGKLGEAIENFSKAVELEPTIDNLLQRGMAEDAAGRHAKAIEDYDRVISLYPERPYAYRARAYAREATGDKKGAQADREKARSIEYPRYERPPTARR